MIRLVLATANPGKAAEIEAVLGGVAELLPRPAGVPEPVEDGGSLLANARIKARAVLAATGTAAVADDTGLEVDALGGAPGVDTASHDWQWLLAELGARPDRRATWRTIALVAWPDGTETWAEGTCAGSIATGARGTAGFGYDPVFVPDDRPGLTFAELSPDDKNAVSHRGRAFRSLGVHLRSR